MRFLTPALLCTLTPIVAQAATVFSFGESDSYVTANQNLTGGNDVTGISGSNISPASDYTGPAFIGGRDVTGGTLSSWFIRESTGSTGTNGDNDSIAAQVTSANNQHQDILIVFEQSQFETGFTGGNISLDGTSSFTITARRNGGNTGGAIPTGLRWIIREGSTYYASALNSIQFSNTIDAPGNTLLEADPTALDWYQYDPLTSISLSTETSANPTFSNITAFGFYYANGRGTGSNFLSMDFTRFEVDAVPEPSSSVALLGAVAIAFAISRRRR